LLASQKAFDVELRRAFPAQHASGELDAPRVVDSWVPLVRQMHLRAADGETVFVTGKPETEDCHEAARERFDPVRHDWSVGLEHEVKTLLYCDRRTEAIHVFVCRAHLDVRAMDPTLALLEADRFGLAAYTINPVNTLAALSRSDRHVRAYLDPGLRTETFLTNNLGIRTISCAARSDLYMGAVDTLLRGFDPQRLQCVEDRDCFFNVYQQRLWLAGDHGRDLRSLPGRSDDPGDSERPRKPTVPVANAGFEFIMRRVPRGTDPGSDTRVGVRSIAEILDLPARADRSPYLASSLARAR
jgi:hypothetical protein